MSKTVIATSKAPGAIGPYSQGIKAGNIVFTSGQLPINAATGENEKNDIKKATAQCLENVKAVLEEAGTCLENVVKTTVFLTDLANFKDMNEVYASYFKSECPARSCYQVSKLPLESIVEIEVIAVL